MRGFGGVLMGINWKRVIKDQSRGVDPVTAFNREQAHMREESRKRFEEEQERRSQLRKREDPEGLSL